MSSDQTLPRPDSYVLMRRDGVAVVLDVTHGRLPAIVHWGADLGDLTGEDVATLALTGVRAIDTNRIDVPQRQSLLPLQSDGWFGRPGLSGHRAGGTDWSPRLMTTTLVVDGREVAEAGCATGVLAVVRAEDATAGIRLELEVELCAGGLLRSRATVTNLADDPYELDDLVLAYPVPPVATELLDFAGRWALERVPQRSAYTVGTHLREGRKGRTGADAATVLHAVTPATSFRSGEAWGVHVGWSGNHTHYAERLSTGERVVGGGELLLPGEVSLGAGDSYTSPWLYGTYGRGLDECARRFHTFLRSRPSHPSPQRPVTLNVWEAVYFDHDLTTLRELADIAAAIGVERYVLDDGWFGSRRDDHSGLGDWTVSPDVWPDGLHPLVDHVTGLGMQFGLWFEPEMVNIDSDLARAHPDWVMAPAGRLPLESRHQQVLNLGIDACYRHIRDAIFAMLAEYDISYIKWDHNRDLVEAGTLPAGTPGVHAQTLAVYRLIDEIKAAHPGLEIESCSSGGARVDLGILERTDRVWVSDCIDPHDRQHMLQWTGQILPPELMGSHIASGISHTTGRSHDLGFRVATALFGHLGLEWDLRQATDAERTELTSWIAFYKQWRDLIGTGTVVRVDTDASQVAKGIVAQDRSVGLYSFASVDRPIVVQRGRVRFPGLDPERRYRVEPVTIGRSPSGLRLPEWWVTPDPGRVTSWPETTPTVVLPGVVLDRVGLVDPPVNPDQALLYLVSAVD
ncbi:MAG TPA: alpha-galactosidase [Propionibacteriaceae bacterium]|nr:alpha-galactosidase [Propionibacteriaceae bacterium]